MKKLTIILASILCINAAQAAYTSYQDAFEQSRKNLEAKAYPAAENDANEALKLAKSSKQTGKTLVVLGEILYRDKKYQEARSQWRKVLALTDFDPLSKLASRTAIAQSYAAEGQVDKAIDEYKYMLADDKIGPGNKGIITSQLVDIYIGKGQFDRARQELDQMLVSYKSQSFLTSYAHYRIAQIYSSEKSYEKALEEFTASANIDGLNAVSKANAEKQIKLLAPLVQLEKEVQNANKLPDAATASSGACLDCG